MTRLCWFVLAVSAFGQNWPQFRGANASGIADGKPLPVRWNREHRVEDADPRNRRLQSHCLGRQAFRHHCH